MRTRSAIRLTALGAALATLVMCVFATRNVRAATATASLAVSVSVTVNCTVSTTALAFGSYDPLVANAATPLDGTATVSVACTKGATSTVGLNLGSNASGSTRRMTDGSSSYLNYEIYQDAGHSTTWGNAAGSWVSLGAAPSKTARNITAYGRIPQSQDVPAGSYSDTVTATVTF